MGSRFSEMLSSRIRTGEDQMARSVIAKSCHGRHASNASDLEKMLGDPSSDRDDGRVVKHSILTGFESTSCSTEVARFQTIVEHRVHCAAFANVSYPNRYSRRDGCRAIPAVRRLLKTES